MYDTSGPWGDPNFHGDVTQGLPPLRAQWIRDRGDIEEISGRTASPRDDGYLSEKVHRVSANGQRSKFEIRNSKIQKFAARKLLRGRAASAVTQLAYARRGIITPEMEFIAIRENLGREMRSAARRRIRRLAERLPQRSALSPSRLRTNWQLAIGNWKSRSLPNSSAPKWRAAAPSFPQTSIIPNPSR